MALAPDLKPARAWPMVCLVYLTLFLSFVGMVAFVVLEDTGGAQ